MVRSDIFGHGSTTHEIMMGDSPHKEFDSDKTLRLYKTKDFLLSQERLMINLLANVGTAKLHLLKKHITTSKP
jgi:hypothetical protein